MVMLQERRQVKLLLFQKSKQKQLWIISTSEKAADAFQFENNLAFTLPGEGAKEAQTRKKD